ncbi:MAG: hypothetical protein AABM67_03220 [Acidobacteriota bacterium]
MQNENNLFAVDDLAQRIETATKEVIAERGLTDRVTVQGAEPKQDSDRFTVGLHDEQAEAGSRFPWFYIDPLEVHAGGAITVETLKPVIRRELLKLFPESATHY